MDTSAFPDKGRIWLNLSLFMLLTSSSLYVLDYIRSDLEILRDVKDKLQSDFEDCISYYSTPDHKRTHNPDISPAVELTYDQTGKLINWSNNKFLQEDEKIHRLASLPLDKVWESRKFIFYQIRKSYQNGTYVALIPIYNTFEINNRFLVPYIFLGRWQNSNLFSEQDKRSLKITPGQKEQGILISDLDGLPVFTIEYLPPQKFRRSIRIAVLGFFVAGIIFFFVFLRLYTLKRWNYRYLINLLLLLIILLIRGTFYLLDLPDSYITLELFQPTILSFSNLAPSLGDLTLNILTILITSWILKIYAFRLLNYVYRKITRYSIFAWIIFIASFALSVYLLKDYATTFEKITRNSKVDVEFANVFAANINSYLILLDVGLLLLAFSFIIFTLLRFNIVFGLRNKFSIQFLILSLLSIISVCLFIHWDDPVLGLVNGSVIILFLIVVYRYPFRQILHQDLANYLLIIMIFSALITFHVVRSIHQKSLGEAKQITGQILGNQVGNIAFALQKSEIDMTRFKDDIQRKYKRSSSSEFSVWVQEEYLDPIFKGYDVKLFMFDSNGRPLINYQKSPPLFSPNTDLKLEDRAEFIAGTDSLFQLPNYENRYADMYIARFRIKLSSGGPTTFILELRPIRRETEGLYPSLSMDEKVYDDTKLINSFDHAIYRDELLYYHRGNQDFPLSIESEDSLPKTVHRRTYIEYKEQIDKRKIVVVRFPRQNLFGVVSLFSFIFYFYIFSALLIIALPVYLLRSLNAMPFSFHFALRTKIRIGLLIISILPMFIIISFLYPFIQERYEKQAEGELIEEASRLTSLLGEDYVFYHNDKLGKYYRLKEFRKKIQELESVVRNDINVFDVNGKRLASTQPLIFEAGLSSNLMNSEAFKVLSTGNKSYLVVKEQIGKLKYLSCYWPIIGNYASPIGYINVTYIAKQDQLEAQVLDFLAYLINIYLLIFLIINLVAVLASDALSKPLLLLQQRLSSINLGHVNKPIEYHSRDEIGAIVKAYNTMVSKLADSEKKLAQTQRELAWRQMARQVAHEIKNPLTPMKLSIQHLSRAWQEKAGSLDRMFPRVMKTLLVQIDTMVRIANSFSEFAKMPEPAKSKIIVNDILLEVVDLYAQSEDAMWIIDIPPTKFEIFADRDQLQRCFNNLIKNGLQAIDGDGIMHISMDILDKGDRTRIEIKDNGKGMTEEVQEKAFEPSFSTKSSGMGLGLAMVKRIIELCDGKIYFVSALGKGTSFFIELPSVQANPQQDLAEIAQTSNGTHELINGNGTTHHPSNGKH